MPKFNLLASVSKRFQDWQCNKRLEASNERKEKRFLSKQTKLGDLKLQPDEFAYVRAM